VGVRTTSEELSHVLVNAAERGIERCAKPGTNRFFKRATNALSSAF